MSLTAAFESLEGVRDEWSALLLPPRAGQVFLRPRWQEVWLQEFGRERDARFLAVREDGRLVALASLLDEGERVTFLGDYNICDYMDFVFTPGREEEALAAAVDALIQDGRREIALWGLREGSPTPALLPPLAKQRGQEATVEDEAVCPQLDLPSTWEDYLTLLGGKNRHELRRKMRRLQSTVGEMSMRVLCSPPDVREGMDEFLRLMTLKSDKAQFMTPVMEGFFRRMGEAMAEEGLVGLYVFDVGGKPAATVFCFEDAEETLLYNSGYDPQYANLAIGLISKAMCLQNAIAERKRRLDFLRGNEPYKYDLGAKDHRVYRCLIKKA